MGGIINRSRRFSKLKEKSPGPADYANVTCTNLKNHNSLRTSFGSSHIGLVKRESMHVPGPGQYNKDLLLIGKDLKLSIPKVYKSLGKKNEKSNLMWEC